MGRFCWGKGAFRCNELTPDERSVDFRKFERLLATTRIADLLNDARVLDAALLQVDKLSWGSETCRVLCIDKQV